jgi:hypothetical protein
VTDQNETNQIPLLYFTLLYITFTSMVDLCVLFLLLQLAALTWRAAMAGKFWFNPNKLTILYARFTCLSTAINCGRKN